MGRKLLGFFSSEEFIIVFLSLILLGLSYGPLAWHYLNPPAGKVFTGSVGFPLDFFGNMSVILEGRLGHWRYFSKHTSILTGPATLLKTDYLLLGQLSRLFSLNPVFFVHLVRLALTVIFIFLSYFLIGKVFQSKTQRIIAFLLAFFSTAMGPVPNKLIDLWTPLAVFQRSAYYPHYLFSFVFILLSLYFLSRALSQLKPRELVWAIFFGFMAAYTHPPTIISLYLTLPIYWLLLLKNKDRFLIIKTFYLFFFGLVTTLPLLYLFIQSRTFPWNIISKGDLPFNISSAVSPWEFLLGIGPTLILALLGAFLAINKGGDLNLLLVPWSVVYIIGFFGIWRLIGYNSARFLQTPFFVILGILTAFIFDKKRLRLSYLAVLLIIAFSLPNLIESAKMNYQNPYIYARDAFLPPERLFAFAWLAKNTQEKEAILAGPVNGVMIVSHAGNIPYLSLFTRPLDNYSELENKMRLFFTQNWSEAQAKRFIEQEKIKLVFWGEEEKSIGLKSSLDYSFLTKVFENSEVTIYRTQL